MKHRASKSSLFAWLMVLLALSAACQTRPTAKPFVTGLNQPRGMAFDEAGNLYVAEAGAVGPDDDGSIAPIINHSSRVTRLAPDGRQTTVLAGLPFTNYIAAGDIGAADIVIFDETIYVLTGEGFDDTLSRAVLRVGPAGSPQVVASIRQFVEAIAPADSLMSAGASFATNPYAMVAAPDGQAFYITDGASGRVLHMPLAGSMRVLAEVADSPPLTGLAFDPEGRLYVALFSALPPGPGNGAIMMADGTGALTVVQPDLTLPIDIGFDAVGTMYVLEFGDGGTPQQPYTANSGRLLRLAPDSPPAVVLTQLNYPTAMVFSRQGDLYLTVGGAFSAPGQGAILKVPCRALGVSAACESGP